MKNGLNQNDVDNLFVTLDTDNNGLIDALEMMIVLALLSGMDSIEKVYFVFSAYDFLGVLSNL